MLAWNTLRVDPGNGSPAQDYRIANGHVEMSVPGFDTKCDPGDRPHWQRLTREQLSWHVLRNTAVAQWLQRRMGVHSLIRACAQSGDQVERAEESSLQDLAA